METMSDSLAACAPYANSYKRYAPAPAPAPAPVRGPPEPPVVPSRPEAPSLFAYNVRLKALAKKKHALDECLALLAELRAAALLPDKYTYSHLLTACAAAAELDVAMRLFRQLRGDGVQLDNHLRTNLLTIAAAAKPPRLDFCVRLFRMTKKPSRVMCNVMMDAFARCGKVDDCLATFRYMGLRGLASDAYTVSALVKAFVVTGRLKEAVHKIEEMRRAGLDVPSAAFGQVMDAYGKKSMMDEAVAVFDLMTLYGVPPTQVTYNILIGACAHVKMPERAFDIYEEMKHTSAFSGDRYTYHSLMKACLSVRDGYRALDLYRQIRASRFHCNQISYRYALTAAGQIMDLDAVLEVAQDMKDAKCALREDTIAALVAAAIRCSDLEAALGFFSEYVKSKPDKVQSLFGAIRAALRSFEGGQGVDFEQTACVVHELERSWARGSAV